MARTYSPKAAAAAYLGAAGLPVTARLIGAATRAVEAVRTRGADVGQMPTDMLSETIAQEIANDLGLQDCIAVAQENYRLANRRVPMDIPREPSVQDVAYGILVYALAQVARKEIEAQS